MKVLTAGDGRVCDYCRALEGKTFTITEALDRMPLPGPNCDDGACRYVLAVVPRVTS